MRSLAAVFALCLLAGGVEAEPAPAWRTAEVIVAGAFTLTIQREQPAPGQQGSEESPRLRITALGKEALVVSLEGGLMTLHDGLDNHALAAGNRLRSRYVLDSPRLKDRAGGPLLMVFGQAFASDPGSFRVISLAGAKPQVVLAEETFQLHDIADVDHDGVPDLIGQRSLSQSFDRCRWTYDPYSVLVLSAATGRYEYSEPLSKAYNLAHYYGWAGPTGREDVAVDRCKRSGSKIVPAPKPEG